MLFDEVIVELLRSASQPSALATAHRITVVRDIRGRVRLVVDPGDAVLSQEERARTEEVLRDRLGDWYAGPALYTDSGGMNSRMAGALLQHAGDSWPDSWPDRWTDSLTGAVTSIDPNRWSGLQQVLSKEQWISDQRVDPPWPLLAATPSITSFYSHKGGVGRSTLTALVAARLAQQGRSVLVIDLDLEAPGLHEIFGVEHERGVLDYLVEHLALGSASTENLWVDVSSGVPGLRREDGGIRLVPAGRLDRSYLEKLARLDYSAHAPGEGEQSPVERALRELLKELRRAVSPDHVLLDARTGLHDIGGLALHALSHLDVFLARDHPQDESGLEIALHVLRQRRSPEQIRVLFVQAMAPMDRALRERRAAMFRERCFDLASRTIFRDMDDEDIPSSAELPLEIVPLDPNVAHAGRLSDIDSTWVEGRWVTQIVERIAELTAGEEGEE